jgi:hypothetical protein
MWLLEVCPTLARSRYNTTSQRLTLPALGHIVLTEIITYNQYRANPQRYPGIPNPSLSGRDQSPRYGGRRLAHGKVTKTPKTSGRPPKRRKADEGLSPTQEPAQTQEPIPTPFMLRTLANQDLQSSLTDGSSDRPHPTAVPDHHVQLSLEVPDVPSHDDMNIQTPSIMSYRSGEIAEMFPPSLIASARLQEPLNDISACIEKAFPNADKPIQEVRVEVSWDLTRYCRTCLDGPKDLKDFKAALTVSGTVDKAYATTCAEYMQQFWPEAEWDLLDLIYKAIKSDPDEPTGMFCLLPKRLHSTDRSLDYESTNGKLKICLDYIAEDEEAKMLPDQEYTGGVGIVTVDGSRADLISIAQQMAWLGACFRTPRLGQLDYSDVSFFQKSSTSFSLELQELRPIEVDKLCWYPMFVNTVLAFGFPAPPRNGEKGVELPFELMTALGRIWYPKEFLNGFVLKGYSTALIPVSRYGTSIQWHYVSKPDRLTMEELETLHPEVLVDLDPDSIMRPEMRMFLGLYKTAVINLGTEGSGYDRIQKSQAPVEKGKPVFARELTISLGLSKFVSGVVGTKVRVPAPMHPNITMDDRILDELLRASRFKPMLLFDLDTRRGWIVPELSGILHLLHTWASDSTGPPRFSSSIPHARISRRGGPAAYHAIFKQRSLLLQEASGNDSPLYLIDAARQMCKFLSFLTDAAKKQKEEVFPRSSYLYGWDFIEVARKNPDGRRMVEAKICRALKTFLANPDMVVLMGKNLGQPIRPLQPNALCASWTPVPHHRDFVVVSVPLIEHLTESRHGEANCPRIAEKQYCTRSPQGKLFEPCVWDDKHHCNRVQQIGSHPPDPQSYPLFSTGGNGAILFGTVKNEKKIPCTPYDGNDDISIPFDLVDPRENDEYDSSLDDNMPATQTDTGGGAERTVQPNHRLGATQRPRLPSPSRSTATPAGDSPFPISAEFLTNERLAHASAALNPPPRHHGHPQRPSRKQRGPSQLPEC